MLGEEDLLSSSGILLFGREMRDLIIDKDWHTSGKSSVGRLGANKFLQESLRAPEAKLAKIFGFSYEGRYYEMSAPAVFLVHGIGEDPVRPRPHDEDGKRRLAPGPGPFDKVGVAYQQSNFAVDVKVWKYDKSEFSLRLDVSAGMLEDILLNVELSEHDELAQFSGGKVGGGKVGGGKVGGGKVGG